MFNQSIKLILSGSSTPANDLMQKVKNGEFSFDEVRKAWKDSGRKTNITDSVNIENDFCKQYDV